MLHVECTACEENGGTPTVFEYDDARRLTLFRLGSEPCDECAAFAKGYEAAWRLVRDVLCAHEVTGDFDAHGGLYCPSCRVQWEDGADAMQHAPDCAWARCWAECERVVGVEEVTMTKDTRSERAWCDAFGDLQAQVTAALQSVLLSKRLLKGEFVVNRDSDLANDYTIQGEFVVGKAEDDDG